MKRFLIILTSVLVASMSANAQLKRANKKYNNLAYTAAIPKYVRALKRDSSNFEAQYKLADSYRLTNDMKNAERIYAKVVMNSSAKPEHYLYYAQALMEREKYPEAMTWLDKYKAVAGGDVRAVNLKEGINNIQKYKGMQAVYTIKATNLNTEGGDFSPVIYNGGLVFTSNRKTLEQIGFDHSWTGRQFYRLYQAKGSETNFSNVTAFAEDVQTKFHNGPVCFNSTGTQLFYTRNNIENGKVGKDGNDVIRMKLFSSQWSDGNWGIDVPFKYNNDAYSCADPALSADGKTLYFASDMPGGQGNMDIWMSAWNGSEWDAPVNLGTNINTPGIEVFPTVTANGTVYFASNGLPGLGGLDIYYTEKVNGSWKPALNMGSPINCNEDDFGICINADANSGYFSSNRKGQGIDDDIYYFKKTCTNTDVLIVDEVSGSPLKEAEVKVLENGIETSKVMTDESGKFNMCLNPLNSYEFIAKKSEYNENKSMISSADLAAAAATGTSVKVPLKKNGAKLEGKVYNADDKSAVPDQLVTLVNKTTGEELTSTTDANGRYSFNGLSLNSNYEVRTSKKDCGDVKEPFNTNKIVGEKTITMDMALLCKGDIIKIENIYYDYNKFNIRADAAIELDKVVALLNKYPAMQIELRSHTDARGKDEYNRKLSDNRAKSAVEYIITKGISKERLVAKGYGESELLNHCKNDVVCDDKTHEQNRRTEFKILKM